MFASQGAKGFSVKGKGIVQMPLVRKFIISAHNILYF